MTWNEANRILGDDLHLAGHSSPHAPLTMSSHILFSFLTFPNQDLTEIFSYETFN